eukprot:s3841_g2.t1
MAKFRKQTTFSQEPDILHAIDARFDELEETVALASMVPELHERLAKLEEMMTRMSQGIRGDFKGPQIANEPPPAPIVPPDDIVGMKDEVDNDEKKLHVGNDTPKSEKSTKSHVSKITEFSRRKTSDITEELLDTQTKEYYTWGESTWDLVIFIGTGALGPAGSFQTFLLAVINVLMQVVFCAIAYFNFIEPDIDSSAIEDCWGNLRKYLNSEKEGLASFFTGEVLCIVALICWYLMVAKEVSHALALHRGVMAVERGPTRLDTRENPFTQATHYRLRAMGLRRKSLVEIASGILLAYRLIAAALLVFVGTFFLVYTVNVTELILNADIDDLLFDALATTPGRHLVHQLDPLPMPPVRRWRGADLKSVCMSILIPGMTIVVYLTMLEPKEGDPFVTLLKDVSTTMCGGYQGFVWDVDSRRVVLMAPTAGGGWEAEAQSIRTRAIDELLGLQLEGCRTPGASTGRVCLQLASFLLNGPIAQTPQRPSDDAKYGVWVDDVSELLGTRLLQLSDVIDEENPSCDDLAANADDPNAEPEDLSMLRYLRFFVGNESIQGCADVAHLCSSYTKIPEYTADGGLGFSETCQCRVPGGDQISVQGCPYGRNLANGRPCQSQPEYITFRTTGVCLEKSAEEMRNDTAWASWVDAIRAYATEDNADLPAQEDALLLADAMWDHGCGFIANLSSQNVSWGNCFQWDAKFEWEFKTVEPFCPLTCQCDWNNRATSNCPLPYGKTCDDLDECATFEGQHYCMPFVPGIQASFDVAVQTLNQTVLDFRRAQCWSGDDGVDPASDGDDADTDADADHSCGVDCCRCDQKEDNDDDQHDGDSDDDDGDGDDDDDDVKNKKQTRMMWSSSSSRRRVVVVFVVDETILEFAGNGLEQYMIFNLFAFPVRRRLGNSSDEGAATDEGMQSSEAVARQLQFVPPVFQMYGEYRIIQIKEWGGGGG